MVRVDEGVAKRLDAVAKKLGMSRGGLAAFLVALGLGVVEKLIGRDGLPPDQVVGLINGNGSDKAE